MKCINKWMNEWTLPPAGHPSLAMVGTRVRNPFPSYLCWRPFSKLCYFYPADGSYKFTTIATIYQTTVYYTPKHHNLHHPEKLIFIHSLPTFIHGLFSSFLCWRSFFLNSSRSSLVLGSSNPYAPLNISEYFQTAPHYINPSTYLQIVMFASLVHCASG
jgi:hypothetical protein